MTLVEVLVASVILGVGVAGLMLAATAGLRNQQRSDQRIAATYFAQEKLAEVETVGPHVYSLSRPTSGTEPRGEVTYTWNVQCEALTAGELYRVHVDVNWQGSGGEGNTALETLLNDYEAAAAEMLQERERKGAVDANAPPSER